LGLVMGNYRGRFQAQTTYRVKFPLAEGFDRDVRITADHLPLQ
jgi:hypothetical protein